MLFIKEMPEFRKLNSKKFVQVRPSDTVLTTVRKMGEADVHGVTIVKDKKPVGIFTESDVIHKIILGKIKLTDKIETAMTKNPKTLTVDHRTSDAIETMKKGKFRYLPVVDDKKEIAGMISLKDLVSLDWMDLWVKSKRRGLIEFFKSSQLYILGLAIILYTAIVVTLLL